MCISPDEMTNEELENSISRFRDYAANTVRFNEQDRDWYSRRADAYEAILKERSDEGTLLEKEEATEHEPVSSL